MTSASDYRNQVVTWLAILAAIPMYYVVMHNVRPVAPVDNPVLVNALLGAALVLVGASFVLKSVVPARAPGEQGPRLQRVGFILALILCETAALSGVVIWFLTASPRSTWFLGIGAAGILMHFPGRHAQER